MAQQLAISMLSNPPETKLVPSGEKAADLTGLNAHRCIGAQQLSGHRIPQLEGYSMCDPKVGRAEVAALDAGIHRQGRTTRGAPGLLAPFVVVGEGAPPG